MAEDLIYWPQSKSKALMLPSLGAQLLPYSFPYHHLTPASLSSTGHTPPAPSPLCWSSCYTRLSSNQNRPFNISHRKHIWAYALPSPYDATDSNPRPHAYPALSLGLKDNRHHSSKSPFYLLSPCFRPPGSFPSLGNSHFYFSHHKKNYPDPMSLLPNCHSFLCFPLQKKHIGKVV